MPKIVDKDVRRRAIVAAATAVFAARGYHLARMEDVSAAMGVSKGSLYEYFETKEDLFMQVCLALVPWEGLGAPSGTAEARLRGLIAAIVARYEKSQDFFVILSDFWTAALRGPKSKRAAMLATGAEFYVPPRRALKAVIEAGQREGVFKSAADAHTLANLLIAAIEGIRLQHQLDPRAARKDRAVILIADMIVRELAHDGDATRSRKPARPSAKST